MSCNMAGKRETSSAFKTKDGYIVVGAGNDHQFVTVCKILNLPEVSKDSRYKTNTLRVQNRKELIDILSTRFSEKVTIEWLQLFEGSGVPYGPINNMQQVFSDPQRCSIQLSDHLHCTPLDSFNLLLPILWTPDLDTILQLIKVASVVFKEFVFGVSHYQSMLRDFLKVSTEVTESMKVCREIAVDDNVNHVFSV
ncbi:hypothetical protein DUI87_18658 [Hirundo rustica rustica]|uniref:Uncharacterized protein n=1 Tax=Hirundo rustica rustica TaxID=333673 RepID=A0A3M0JXD9_HIRRU|nr:hypothetical protein DUI87_18658 [Hirundo rustica rustica]